MFAMSCTALNSRFPPLYSFCSQHHGTKASKDKPKGPPPEDLMCVAENILPRIILRLLQHLRVNTVLTRMQLTPAGALERYEKAIDDADRFLKGPFTYDILKKLGFLTPFPPICPLFMQPIGLIVC